MKRLIPLVVFLIVTSQFTSAQTPDWSSKIANIIYSNCSSCHHEGGIGPFSLMTYDDAVTNATNIQAYVVAGKMPPWPPDPSCSYQIIGDRRLSDDDINAINDWVNGGAPSGDLASAPLPPTFSANSSVLNGIDLTVALPHYTVQLATDEYRTFVIHSGFTDPHYINQLEVQPGNNSIVHHVLVYYDPTSASNDADLQDSLPGFSTNGTNTPSASCVMIGGWAPGAQAQKLPANMAYQVPANADFVVEVHYAPGSIGKSDSTKVNLKYCTQASPRLLSTQPILFHYWPCISPALNIPANTVKSFHEKSLDFSVPQIDYNPSGDYSLLGVAPHMHLIGKSWNVYMTSPTNDTTNLVCIPDWNFHWQLGYEFHNLIHFHAGAGYHLGAKATYDNTSNNPNNPSNPPVDVTLGERTIDEMMIVFFSFLNYQPGDDTVILEQTTGVNMPVNPSLPLSLFPNPASDEVELSAILPANDLQINIMNTAGVVIKSFDQGHQLKGMYATRLSLKDIPQGIYLLEISSGGIHSIKKLVKLE
ncbi:MAG TPA: T9SS type A sorting domain-containing protein [Chitinophagales bacterium]|nr:T9SS type A sorting domain-containing protein [Chitinophagales bacterium]